MDLIKVSTNERAEVWSRMAEVSWLDEGVDADGEYSEVLCVSCVPVVVLMAERATLTAESEQEKAEPEVFATCILELEFAAATCNGELGVWSCP